MTRKLIGQYLLRDNLVSETDLQRALELQALQPGRDVQLIGTILIRIGALKEQDVTRILEQQQRDAQIA